MAQCTAKSKRSGKRCRRDACRGTTVCANHGGKAPQVEAKAARTLALREVAELVASLPDTDKTLDPLSQLLQTISHSAHMTAVLRMLVDALVTPSEEGTEEEKRATLYGPNHLGDGAPHVLVTELRKWSDQLARHCKMALDAGVAERQVRIAEAQGQLLAEVVTRILDDPKFGLSQKQRAKGRKVAAGHLRAI